MTPSTPTAPRPAADPADRRSDSADPIDPEQLHDQLRFMSNRLKQHVKNAPDEDLARRLTFARMWIDSAIARLETDRALEEAALGEMSLSGGGQQVL